MFSFSVPSDSCRGQKKLKINYSATNIVHQEFAPSAQLLRDPLPVFIVVDGGKCWVYFCLRDTTTGPTLSLHSLLCSP